MLEAYVALDLEMTGLKAKTDRILEIGAVKVVNHQITDVYQQLVNPKMEIPKEITELTGITSEMAKGGADTKTAVENFFAFCGELPLVGHNLVFDYSFLKQYAVNHGLAFEKEAVDTLKLSRKLLPEAEKKTLDYLCMYLHIERENSHRALEDAKAAFVLLEYLMEHFGAEHEEAFLPKPLIYKVKKQSPITPRQIRYLKDLTEYHKIELGADIDSLTRNEASRMTDKILTKYGRLPEEYRTRKQ